jgi:hypothetical protein
VLLAQMSLMPDIVSLLTAGGRVNPSHCPARALHNRTGSSRVGVPDYTNLAEMRITTSVDVTEET